MAGSIVGDMKGLLSRSLADAGGMTNSNVPGSPLGVLLSAGSLASAFANSSNKADVSPSLTDRAKSLLKKADSAQRMGTIAYCTVEVLTDPTAMTHVLQMLLENLGAAIGNLVGTVLDAVMNQVGAAIDNVIHTIGSLINSVIELVVSVAKLVRAFDAIRRNWFAEGASWREARISTQYCEQLVATLLACLLNKLLGDPIEDLKNKLVSRINKVGGSFNSAIQAELEDTQILANFIGREARLVGTAAAQIQGIADTNKRQAEAYALMKKAEAKSEQNNPNNANGGNTSGNANSANANGGNAADTGKETNNG